MTTNNQRLHGLYTAPQPAEQSVPGVSARDRLAEQAMLGLLQGGNVEHRNAGAVARVAYTIADAMLKEREKWMQTNAEAFDAAESALAAYRKQQDGEAMTTNEPEVFRFDCHGHNAPAYSCNKPADNSGEYVRLSGYETLQAECEKLVEALEEARHHVIISPDVVRSGFIQEIDAALAAHRKGGDQ